jgi:putative transposase
MVSGIPSTKQHQNSPVFLISIRVSQCQSIVILNPISRKYKIRDQDKLYFVTFTVIRWLDVFTRNVYKDIFLDSLRYCQKHKGLELCAFCIMTGHVHLIIGRNKEPGLDDIIRDIKKYTAVKIIEEIQNNPQESRKELFLWLFRKAGKSNKNNTNFQFWGSNIITR